MTSLDTFGFFLGGTVWAWLWLLLHDTLNSAAGRLETLHEHSEDRVLNCENPGDFALVVTLLKVASTQGSSLPQCFLHVGICLGDSTSPDAMALVHVGKGLLEGSSWKSVWAGACVGVKKGSRKNFQRLQSAVEPTWKHGVSPSARLTALAESTLESEEASVSVDASRLSVRLLIPMGLCFLPAFVLIGVIPTIMSFIQGS